MDTKTKAGIAAGVTAALGAAAAGYYFYADKNAKKHRDHALKWMSKAEKEIMVRAMKLKDAALDEKNYKAVVDAVVLKYQTLPKVDPKDLAKFRKALKGAWKEFRKARKKAEPHLKRAAKKASKGASRMAKAASRS